MNAKARNRYVQNSILQKLFNKTTLAIAAIMIGIYVAVILLGNIIKLS